MTWVYTSFLGLSRVIAPAMNYTGFIALFIAAVVAGVGIAVSLVRPRVEWLITSNAETGLTGAAPI